MHYGPLLFSRTSPFIYIYIRDRFGGGVRPKGGTSPLLFRKMPNRGVGPFFSKKLVFMAFLCDNLSKFLKFLKKLRKYTVFNKNFDVFAEFFQKFSEFFQKFSFHMLEVLCLNFFMVNTQHFTVHVILFNQFLIKKRLNFFFGAEKVELVLCFLPKSVELAPPHPKSIPAVHAS